MAVFLGHNGVVVEDGDLKFGPEEHHICQMYSLKEVLNSSWS